jgi:hypothetical protein
MKRRIIFSILLVSAVAVASCGHEGALPVDAPVEQAQTVRSFGPIRAVAHGSAAEVLYLASRPTGQPYRWKLIVEVEDDSIRQQVAGFDGFEKAFALVPFLDNQGLINWNRVELAYSFTHGDRDVHFLHIPDGPDKIVIDQYGIAFGLESNVGRLWLQAPGVNTTPRVVQSF